MFPWEEDPKGGSLAVAALVAVVAAMLGVALFLPAAAGANTESIISEPFDPHDPQENSGWQAGTCKAEPSEPGVEKFCSVATPKQFFETAAGHPNWGFTQFIVRHTTVPLVPPLAPLETPVGELKTVRVDLPVGLSVNPGATVVCKQTEFNANACPEASKVGQSEVTVSVAGLVVAPIPGITLVPVYNVEPLIGGSARFGLMLAGNPVYLEGDVEWASDYHEGFTIA